MKKFLKKNWYRFMYLLNLIGYAITSLIGKEIDNAMEDNNKLKKVAQKMQGK